MERDGGRYDILHLDLHGIVKNDKAYAQFVKRSAGQHNVSAQDHAALLGSHGVQTVVLNACQSAVEGHGSAANLARALIQHGVKTAVAMVYKVIDHTAKVFILSLYEQLLCRKMSPFLAMRAARQCLVSNRTRRTRYQTKISVDDSFVPSIYVHQDYASIYMDAVDLMTMKHNPSPSSPVDEAGEDVDVSLVGRECDLLMLETALLLGSCVLGIQGPPGIGKSALSESAALWWKSTHLIDKFIKIDLDVLSPDSSLAEVLNHELQLGLPVTGKTTGGGDANTVSRIACSLRRTMKRLGRLLILFDGAESSGPHKVSDHDMAFLNKFLSAFQKAQDITAGNAYGRFSLVTARQLARLPTLEGDGQGLVHTLLPLDSAHALALSTSILEKAGKLPQAKGWESLIVTEHFGNLAQGNPLAVRLSAGAYCSQELGLHEYFQTLFRGSHMSFEKLPRELTGHPALKDFKRHFESPNGFCTKARRLFFPSWTSFPFSTLADYLGRTYKTISSGQLKTAARDVLQPFIDEGLATVGKSIMDNSEFELDDEDEYVTLHPLVVLGVRDKATKDHFGTLEMSWPLRELYWNREWDRPRAACQREFYNFLGTTYMALILGSSPAGFHELLHLMHMTVKGLYFDRSRRPLMAEFWKFALQWIGELEDQYQRLSGSGWRKKFELLVLVDISRIILCMSLFDYYSQPEEGEAQKYKGLMMSIYSRRPRLVGYDPIKDAVGPQLEILASSKAAPDPSKNMSAGQLREKAAARRAFYHAIEAKGFDISGFDSAGSSMDGGMLPEGNALLGQDKDVLETVLLAKRKMQSRFPERPDIDGARNLLYKVLEDDLFIGATPASRAAIHRTLSEVVEEGAAKYYERKDESEQDDTKEDFREGREGHWRQAL
ncbi:delta(8)-fatty-acid desaturase [Aspergillus lentulus]|nr:delta(8)-fatty-acid desaturase [Aspergillus lentulus]